MFRIAEFEAAAQETNLFSFGQNQFVKPSRVSSRWDQEYGNRSLICSFQKFANVIVRWIAKHAPPVPSREKRGQPVLVRLQRAGIVIEMKFGV